MLRPDLLDACLWAVAAQEGLFDLTDVILVANGAPVLGLAELWQRRGVTVYRPGRNLGTSRSWNLLCRWAFMGHDAVLILGDDVVLTDPGTIQGFSSFYAAAGFRHMRFVQDRGFSAVCVTRAVWDEVGGFDEGFWPAYFEDNDFWRRFHLRGIDWDHILAPSDHLGGGSQTIKSDPELASLNNVTFPLNRDRYVAKWGAMPLQGEPWAEPWNGGRPLDGVRELLAGSRPDLLARIERPYGPEEPWPWT